MSTLEMSPDEHNISDETLESARRHADISAKHGKVVERIGKSLESKGQELGNSIEQDGKKIQKHAETSKQYIEEALEQEGAEATKTYGLVVEEHVKEAEGHIAANRKYSQALSDRLENREQETGDRE
jgi:myo-inositol-1-phosphate synthase